MLIELFRLVLMGLCEKQRNGEWKMLSQIYRTKYFQFDFPVAVIMPLSLSLKGEFALGAFLLALILFTLPKFIEHECSFVNSKYIEISRTKKIGFVSCWVYSGVLILMFIFLQKNIIFFVSILSVGVPILFRFLSRRRVDSHWIAKSQHVHDTNDVGIFPIFERGGMKNEIVERRTKWKRVLWFSVLLQCGLLLGLYGIHYGKQISYIGLSSTVSEEGKEMIKEGMDIALWSLLAGIMSFLVGSFLMVLSKNKLKELKENSSDHYPEL